MADDESEGDPKSNDSRQSTTAFMEKETTHTRVNLPAQSREIWNTGISPSSGPRALLLKRSENGFGFTLRHFIVYPPESNAILARDRRLGLDVRAVGNEPMDTIFVKNVRENSSASAAGLTTGDRIISVNGEDISGLSYARVIQLIHKTGNHLHLLVVPKENDILQLYFSETAHNPETNQRARMHSPESANVSTTYPTRKSSVKAATVAGVVATVKPTHLRHHYSRCQTSPLQMVSTAILTPSATAVSATRLPGARRSSEGSNERRSDTSAVVFTKGGRELGVPLPVSDTSSCCSSENGIIYGSYANNMPPSQCRYSLDVGMGRGSAGTAYDSLSDSSVKDSYGSEDSLIMSRLRKSVEQKEEFMNRLPQPSATAATAAPAVTVVKENSTTAREFYSRPQKLPAPAWPPNASIETHNAIQDSNIGGNSRSKSSSTSGAINGSGCGGGGSSSSSIKLKTKQNFFATLDKIQENPSTLVPTLSKFEDADCSGQPFQVVSVRTQQFEKGPVDNKTEFHRSELARLTTKLNVANVAARKKDFENRAHQERKAFATRETRSLESANVSVYFTSPSSGNRIVPIGSKKIHCEPPAEFTQVVSTKNNELKSTTDLSLQKNKPVVRQDSYLAACRKPAIKITKESDSGVQADDDVRTKQQTPNLDSLVENEDDKSTRRTSYIIATSGDSMNIDNECDLFSDSEAVVTVSSQRRTSKKWRPPLFPGEIQRLRRFFEDLAATSGERGILGSRKTVESFPDQDQQSVIKEGTLLCKVTQVDGKKAGDRSWKPIWLSLKGPILCLYKERRESLSAHCETPATFDKADLGASCDRIDIRYSVVEVACDYTKRKHVFRLNAQSMGAELLLQADDANSMKEWVKVLQEQAVIPPSSNEPSLTNFSSNVSPSSGNKTLRKLASLRNRSPTGDSPNSKTRKSTQTAETQQTSPKSRNWKNKMAKQFRRIQPGGGNSLSTPSVVGYPPGATIGIPLEACPSSSFSEFVPLLVEICTEIVEAKGLEIIGIYRVPGNTAAVTSLTEAVNRGLDISILDQDSRWSDVNVISSLLKSFFRKLPDALLTAELYPHFIKADRIEDPVLRIATIRKLVHSLPDHNFETLKYLLFHLKRVVANSCVNKMEARNLAIVFGPTLVRNGDDMVTMVTDMSHQCRIVESLLCYADWCFSEGNLAELKANIPEVNSVPELESTSTNQNLLLGNIRKVEGNLQSPVTAKDIVSTIIGAANRKMQKTSKHLIKDRKAHTTHLSLPSSGTSDDSLNSIQNHQVQSSSQDMKYTEKKKETSKSEDNRVITTSLGVDITDSVTNTKENSDLRNKNQLTVDSGGAWTYSGLSATTQERIRRFEQETKAMLQRELSRPKRTSNYATDEVEKEKFKNPSEDSYNDRLAKEMHSSLASYKLGENAVKGEQTVVSSDNSFCDSPPPVVVMRRNLPNVNGKNVTTSNDNNNNMKRLKTGDEFVRNNSMERSGSLDSLNRAGRPLSHVSDDGGDLLMSLTTTFDRKLKSLLTEEEEKKLNYDENLSIKKRNSFAVGQSEIVDNSSFRDPSLHRTLERTSRAIDVQKNNELNKENNEKSDMADEKELRACAACGCAAKHTEKVQHQHNQLSADPRRRSVLQETQVENTRHEPKLFYSNSVKLRRSESLKEDGGTNGKLLRRSGSLNKHESKMSRVETWMLTKNAEAIKLKRADSLTKSEKTETNMIKRRQIEMNKKGGRSEKDGKVRRRNGSSKGNNSIKRRHTVGGTKDFDKVSWLQNQQREKNKENRKERRTSSPDLSSTRMTDFFIEVVVRPRSFISADPNFISRLLSIPLESHV